MASLNTPSRSWCRITAKLSSSLRRNAINKIKQVPSGNKIRKHTHLPKHYVSIRRFRPIKYDCKHPGFSRKERIKQIIILMYVFVKTQKISWYKVIRASFLGNMIPN